MVRLTSVLHWSDYYNIPKRFIDRAKFIGTYIEGNYGVIPKKTVKYNDPYRYQIDPPWTDIAVRENHPKNNAKLPQLVEPLKTWDYFRGDFVEVLAGKHKGKQGNVCAYIRELNYIFVFGLNTELTRIGGNRPGTTTIVVKEKPLIAPYQVKLIDPFDGKPCTIEWRYTSEGELVRVSTRSGRIIPKAPQAEETSDYATKKSYLPGPQDTIDADIKEVTFKPNLMTVEQELMKINNIEETRTPGPTWFQPIRMAMLYESKFRINIMKRMANHGVHKALGTRRGNISLWEKIINLDECVVEAPYFPFPLAAKAKQQAFCQIEPKWKPLQPVRKPAGSFVEHQHKKYVC
ncbi:unnamed protein product [Didymodactylos carnosus]|uniref:Large ribosomal subunit protein uL24 C-terminal domain-containing protein n=1 Tax=Didymodactylos carnosus TaxID=1234261 RepID=A0A813ZMX8_9BILA|nr:unnamed protein product [Didymodactylos carnosus]CAF3684890.1 unnamed protein product [Didymodactylos carnosus]